MIDLSVVIATKNPNLRELNRAVESCLNQEGITVEVVVVDDTPGLCVVDVVDNAAVRVVGGPQQYIGDAVALGHDLAKGEWRTGLDDDDWFEPNALSRLIEVLKSQDNPSGYFAYGNVWVENGLHITPEWTPEINKGDFKTSNGMVWHSRLYNDPVRHYHPANMRYWYEDYDFCVQLECAGVKGIRVDIPVVHWIPRTGGEFQQSRGSHAEIVRRINSRYEGVQFP